MAIYQIRIKGRLDERWSEWFNGLAVNVECEDGIRTVTSLTGFMADQPALRGILNRIWDLNLNLVSIVMINGTDQNVIN
jgi:hypothetical protein